MVDTRTLVKAHSPTWTNEKKEAIGLKVTFKELTQLGEIDFIAHPNDSEPHGKDIFNRAKKGEFGKVQDAPKPLTEEEVIAQWKKDGMTDEQINERIENHKKMIEQISAQFKTK
jgi:hypothetical protein